MVAKEGLRRWSPERERERERERTVCRPSCQLRQVLSEGQYLCTAGNFIVVGLLGLRPTAVIVIMNFWHCRQQTDKPTFVILRQYDVIVWSVVPRNGCHGNQSQPENEFVAGATINHACVSFDSRFATDYRFA